MHVPAAETAVIAFAMLRMQPFPLVSSKVQASLYAAIVGDHSCDAFVEGFVYSLVPPAAAAAADV